MFFFLLILGLSSHSGESTQPCCLSDGSCFDLSEALCTTVGGQVSKASSCAEAACEALGACCTPGLNCEEGLTEAECTTACENVVPCATDFSDAEAEEIAKCKTVNTC